MAMQSSTEPFLRPEKAFRIGFIGSGGTGKTTVAEKILEARPDFQLMPSAPRAVMAKRGLRDNMLRTLPPDVALDLQREIWRQKVKQEQEWKDYKYIADRTLLDHFAYVLYRAGHVIVTPEELREKEEAIRRDLLTYDLVYFFPTGEFLPPRDDFREHSAGYFHALDTIMRGLIAKLDTEDRVCQIRTGSPAERAQQVLTHLTDLLPGHS